LKNCILDLTENEKVIINPGSVGQPRDLDPRASSVIFDLKRNCISVIRAEYDIAKAQKDIIKAGLPKNLASRLSAGM